MAALGREAGADPKCTGQLPMRNGEGHEGMKTAVYTHAQSSSAVGDAKFRRPMVIDIIEKKFENLRKDKTLDLHGTVTLATAASFTGIVSNFVLRSSFNVTYDALKTYASLTALPFLSTIVTYKFLVIDPLYSGNISKENCVLRSSLVGLICGVVYPSALAFSKNGRLAVKYVRVVTARPPQVAPERGAWVSRDPVNDTAEKKEASTKRNMMELDGYQKG